MKTNQKTPVRLNVNENFYGCSPNVFKSLEKSVQNVPLYPNYPARLEEKLADKYNVSIQNIILSGGSVRLIDGIIQTLAAPDEEVLTFERSFIAYEHLARDHGRKCLLAKQHNFTCDVANLFPLITPKTRVIFIANPNNPTGTAISHTQLQNLLETVSKDIFVVIDESYYEYVTDETYPDSLALQKNHPNLIILRTFSKIYGLAGLRVGYGIAHENIAEKLKKSRIPFFLNVFCEEAALAALADEQFIKTCAEKNAINRNILYRGLKALGMHVVPSQANFIFAFFEKEEEKEKVFKCITNNGLLISNLTVFGQDRSLRIGIGDSSTNERILDTLL